MLNNKAIIAFKRIMIEYIFPNNFDLSLSPVTLDMDIDKYSLIAWYADEHSLKQIIINQALLNRNLMTNIWAFSALITAACFSGGILTSIVRVKPTIINSITDIMSTDMSVNWEAIKLRQAVLTSTGKTVLKALVERGLTVRSDRRWDTSLELESVRKDDGTHVRQFDRRTDSSVRPIQFHAIQDLFTVGIGSKHWSDVLELQPIYN
ncbi:unnamed protein product, partial [Medioppia subpectinata]